MQAPSLGDGAGDKVYNRWSHPPRAIPPSLLGTQKRILTLSLQEEKANNNSPLCKPVAVLPLHPRQGFLEKNTDKPCPLVLCFLVAQPPLITVLSPQLCSPKGAMLPCVSTGCLLSPTATPTPAKIPPTSSRDSSR